MKNPLNFIVCQQVIVLVSALARCIGGLFRLRPRTVKVTVDTLKQGRYFPYKVVGVGAGAGAGAGAVLVRLRLERHRV